MYKFVLFFSLAGVLSISCTDSRATISDLIPVHDLQIDTATLKVGFIDSAGTTVQERFILPEGYERTNQNDPFASYLRSLTLHPIDHDVKYYDGSEKARSGIYCSVVNLPIGTRDRHQCADAVMNVRAHYLFNAGQFEDIHFNFTNGFKAEYSEWRKGKRIRVQGNDVSYYSTSKESQSYSSFLDYLQTVYCYAGTYSLDKELESVNIKDISPGDVFIKGGFPGHAILVVDVIENGEGDKQFMLAQSYMPAQELQILINPTCQNGSPWYALNEIHDQLFTPEWTFDVNQLKRFKKE